jgi:hypothetical protein
MHKPVVAIPSIISDMRPVAGLAPGLLSRSPSIALSGRASVEETHSDDEFS